MDTAQQPDPEPLISFVDRRSQAEQIAEILERTRARNEVVRVRIPFMLYDYGDNRNYAGIRDASWNLQLPTDRTTPETIARLIDTIGQCIVAIAREGSENVLTKLAGPMV